MFFTKDTFFANNEHDALNELESRCRCKVRPIVLPTDGVRVYCISEHGELYGIRKMKGTRKYMGYGPIKPQKDRHRNEDICVRFDLYLDTHHTKFVRAEKLVFCTFVLNRWDEDIEINFKDGNQLNVRLDNLEVKHLPIPPEWNERMEAQADVYAKNFNRIVDYVQYFGNITEEDAKDVVQGTFIWIITQKEGEQPQNFVGAWMKWSLTRSTEYSRWYARVSKIGDVEELLGSKQHFYEFNPATLITNEKHRKILELYMAGCTQESIAEYLGTTPGTVSTTIGQIRKKVRRYFGNEIESLRYN